MKKNDYYFKIMAAYNFEADQKLKDRHFFDTDQRLYRVVGIEEDMRYACHDGRGRWQRKTAEEIRGLMENDELFD